MLQSLLNKSDAILGATPRALKQSRSTVKLASIHVTIRAYERSIALFRLIVRPQIRSRNHRPKVWDALEMEGKNYVSGSPLIPVLAERL